MKKVSNIMTIFVLILVVITILFYKQLPLIIKNNLSFIIGFGLFILIVSTIIEKMKKK
jgi:hypothetical protein